MPAAPWIVPALLLVLALAVSAGFKVRAPRTTEDAFVSLRLPNALRAMKAPLVLPYAEFALAAALLLLPSPWYIVAAALALVLFVAYLVVVVRALGFDEPVTCGCFGRLGLGEIDRRTVVRNVFLVAAAALALVDAIRGGSMIERFTAFGGTEWGWIAGVLAAVGVTGLVVHAGVKDAAPAQFVDGEEGAELDYIRQPIPYGALLDKDGQTVPLSSLALAKPVLLVSVSLGCGSCVRTMEHVPGWAADQEMLRVVMVAAGTPAQDAPDLGEHVEWMTDPEGTVVRTLAMAYPSAVLFGMDGQLAGGPVVGYEAIESFLADIDAELSEAQAEMEAAHQAAQQAQQQTDELSNA